MHRSSDIRVVVHYDEAEDAWRVRGGPSDAAYPAREKAVARARTLAHENRAVLVIYDEDGTIQEQQDYGTMGARPSPEEDVTGEKGVEATSRAEERSMHRG